MMINQEGTRMVKNGEFCHGLEKLRPLKLFKTPKS